MQQHEPIDELRELGKRQPWVVPVLETTKLNDALTGSRPNGPFTDARNTYPS